jgi:hypothetical protein
LKGNALEEGQMDRAAFELDWAARSEEGVSGMADWRAQHPQATVREIEAALDTRLAGMRARLLENVALPSRASAWKRQAATARAEWPRCPTGGDVLPPRGKATRRLKTQGGHALALPRT